MCKGVICSTLSNAVLLKAVDCRVRLLSAALPFRVVNARPQDHAQEGGKANLASTGSEMSGSNALLVSICGLQLPESPSIPVGANRQVLKLLPIDKLHQLTHTA